jgi:hypothetical protein
MIESAAEANMFKTKRSRIAGLVVLIAAVLLLGLNFAITRSSPSLPANYNSLRNNVVRLVNRGPRQETRHGLVVYR